MEDAGRAAGALAETGAGAVVEPAGGVAVGEQAAIRPVETIKDSESRVRMKESWVKSEVTIGKTDGFVKRKEEGR
jgi:hypothetical protein